MTQEQGFRDLRPGDRLPPAPPRDPVALVTPGPARWHALRVAPLSEVRVEAWLRARGVDAFHPVRLVRSRRRGRPVAREQRYLPGYVFARFPGAPVVRAVLDHADIWGAIARADGTWGVLDPASLQAILAMRRLDADLTAARRAELARVRAALRVRAGEAARFMAGAFDGRSCEVVELAADGGAVVRLQLFGGEVLVQARAEDLEPVRGQAA